MQAPATVDSLFFAPCGMNCVVCYKHLGKQPCAGCLGSSDGKPATCRACKIKDCTEQQGLAHCFQCEQFPCKRLKALDKSYRTRYGVSLVEYGFTAAEKGITEFLREHTAQYTCKHCGGLISLHDGICSGCKQKYPLGGIKEYEME